MKQEKQQHTVSTWQGNFVTNGSYYLILSCLTSVWFLFKNILLVFLHCETFNELHPIIFGRHQIMLKKTNVAVPLLRSITHLLLELILKVNWGLQVVSPIEMYGVHFCLFPAIGGSDFHV